MSSFVGSPAPPDSKPPASSFTFWKNPVRLQTRSSVTRTSRSTRWTGIPASSAARAASRSSAPGSTPSRSPIRAW